MTGSTKPAGAAPQPPFALRDIDHVVLRARDVRALVDFYVEVLGCTCERVSGNLTHLRAGRALIDIVPRDAADGDGRNVDHICLTLAPFETDRLSDWLVAHGVATGEVATRYGAGGFGESLYLADPEGNGIELKAAID